MSALPKCNHLAGKSASRTSSTSGSTTKVVLLREATLCERSQSAVDLYLDPNRIPEFGLVQNFHRVGHEAIKPIVQRGVAGFKLPCQSVYGRKTLPVSLISCCRILAPYLIASSEAVQASSGIGPLLFRPEDRYCHGGISRSH
jgi:hypothetical protein